MGNVLRLEFGAYWEYIHQQTAKLPLISTEELKSHHEALYYALGERLDWHWGDDLFPGMNALCLGARQGTEVQLLREMGLFAVGVDLMPGDENEYVTWGDFHALSFADGTVDLVYTNAIDHAFFPEAMLEEIARILRDRGVFILEAPLGTRQGFVQDDWARFIWEDISMVISLVLSFGFILTARWRFWEPWRGWHLTFRRAL